MSLIVQRARVRARRTGQPFRPQTLAIALAGRAAVVAAAPAFNRPLRRLSGYRTQITIAAIPAALAAAVLLNLVGPAAQPHAERSTRISTTAPAPIITQSGPAAPGIPSGIHLPQNNDQTTPRLAAVLAADLWQAGTAVYQAQTNSRIAAAPSASPAPSPDAPVPAAVRTGPSLNDLLQAQARLAMAQLVASQVAQPPSDDTLAQARQAIADAQAQIDATQRLLDSNQATLNARIAAQQRSAAAAAERAAAIPAAQQAVLDAQASLDQVQHPYTDDQIAYAQAKLLDDQQALATAEAAAAAPVAAIAAAAPAPAPVGAARQANQAPATTAAAAAPPALRTRPAAAAPAAASPLARSAAPATFRAAAGAQTDGSGLADPRTVDNAAAELDAGALPEDGEQIANDVPAATGAAAAAGPAIGDAQPAFPARSAAGSSAVDEPNGSAPAFAAGTADTTPSAAAVAVAAGASAANSPELIALKRQISQDQATVALYTTPPDPAAVQEAMDTLTAAQQQLADLSQPETPATTTAGSSLTGANATAPADAAATSAGEPESLQSAQARYAQAVQWMQGLTAGPDPATLQAAQAELQAAKHDYDALFAQADTTVTAQIDPDPQSALARLGDTNAYATTHVDTRAFTWPAHGAISSFFGPGHPLGIDIAQGLGGPVTAAASGVVSFSGGDPCCSYGYYIDIVHPNGFMTRYGHLLAPSFLKPGDRVIQGQIIGVSGSTGFSTGPHVHFEIRSNGVPLDPLKLIFGALPGSILP